MSADRPPLVVGVPRETFPDERRVAVVPASAKTLERAGLEVLLETQAGHAAGFPDALYEQQNVRIASSREEVFESADILLCVRAGGANPDAGAADIARLRDGQILIGMCDPLSEPGPIREMAERGAMVFALELLPRITRAQSMDVLSSMATVAGYKAVLLAADALPRMFPMLMTAAGTVAPAKVFIVGAGVAGLQAIATAKRLGAVVRAYDVRPAVKEQVESLGGKFVEFQLETEAAETKGGYAKAMDEEFYVKQREMMIKVVSENDVVITTAAVPGKKAPILVTKEMVHGMQPGSVIVDLAAERGGNCELTKLNQRVIERDVTILGPGNLPSTIPYHASEMYARNIATFLTHLVQTGMAGEHRLPDTLEDEILRETLLTRGGEVIVRL
jgi:H+-translocating NAD(P) transhydrogenase subunit alpha